MPDEWHTFGAAAPSLLVYRGSSAFAQVGSNKQSRPSTEDASPSKSPTGRTPVDRAKENATAPYDTVKAPKAPRSPEPASPPTGRGRGRSEGPEDSSQEPTLDEEDAFTTMPFSRDRVDSASDFDSIFDSIEVTATHTEEDDGEIPDEAQTRIDHVIFGQERPRGLLFADDPSTEKGNERTILDRPSAQTLASRMAEAATRGDSDPEATAHDRPLLRMAAARASDDDGARPFRTTAPMPRSALAARSQDGESSETASTEPGPGASEPGHRMPRPDSDGVTLSDPPGLRPPGSGPQPVERAAGARSNRPELLPVLSVRPDRSEPRRDDSGSSYPKAPDGWIGGPSPWSIGSGSHEQMAPTPWYASRRVLLAAGCAGLALAVLLIAALAGGFSGDDGQASPEPETLSPVERARALLTDGRTEAALAILESADLEAESEGLLVLSQAYAASKRTGRALEAYGRAMAIRRELGRAPEIVERVRVGLDAGEQSALGPALAVTRQALSAGAAGPGDGEHPLRAVLIDAASRHSVYESRRRARALANELGMSDDIDRLASYTLDLRQGKRCKDRRQAVARLRELGDKRAIEALRQAAAGKGMEPSARGKNTCLRKAARQATEHLGAPGADQATP